MGLFDSFLDELIDLPGKVAENTVEAVCRIPEVGVKIVEGAIKGVEKGIEKTGDAFDDLD